MSKHVTEIDRPVAVCEWTASHNYNYNSNTELQNLVVPRNFREFRKILRKHGNSAATAKFRGSARNSAARGKLWYLVIRKRLAHVAQRAYVEVAGFTHVSHMLVECKKPV